MGRSFCRQGAETERELTVVYRCWRWLTVVCRNAEVGGRSANLGLGWLGEVWQTVIMTALPATTPEHYLTGTSAMTIPDGEAAFVNWHFVDTFLDGRASFRIAGRNFPDTSALLGTAGVRECAAVLRGSGVPLPAGSTFYAANRDRAFLDLLLGNLQQGRRPDHLRIDDYSDADTDAEPLRAEIQRLRGRLEAAQIRLLDEWLAQQ